MCQQRGLFGIPIDEPIHADQARANGPCSNPMKGLIRIGLTERGIVCIVPLDYYEFVVAPYVGPRPVEVYIPRDIILPNPTILCSIWLPCKQPEASLAWWLALSRLRRRNEASR
ncbi:hypothetical protein VNO77_27818 [Canavalia gladiata]|uniref:Uncharacterized protein n=1 Tax=Canavalia gladiata TaxID=3824 RepID=A0AAN9KVY4_CANGL